MIDLSQYPPEVREVCEAAMSQAEAEACGCVMFNCPHRSRWLKKTEITEAAAHRLREACEREE